MVETLAVDGTYERTERLIVRGLSPRVLHALLYAQDKIVKLGDDLADQLQVMKQLMTTQENREELEKELKKQLEANDMIRVRQH